MKSIKALIACVCLTLALEGCGSGESSTPFSKLCDIYVEIAENNQEMVNAYQEVYAAPKDRQEALMENAKPLFAITQEKNKELAEQAKTLGAELQGTEIPCEVDPSLGFNIDKMLFASVSTDRNLAAIMLKGEGNAEGFIYVFMLNKNGDTVVRQIGHVGDDGVIRISFRITTDKGPGTARAYAAVRSLKFVTETEYKTGKAPQASEPESSAEETFEPEPNPDPEPAYMGNEANDGVESATVEGVTISKGANLVATLKQFKKITWDYNADFGVTATIGNVWITIDESDLTQKGLDIIHAISSDMENDIAFSVDYIKPSAIIQVLEAQ